MTQAFSILASLFLTLSTAVENARMPISLRRSSLRSLASRTKRMPSPALTSAMPLSNTFLFQVTGTLTTYLELPHVPRPFSTLISPLIKGSTSQLMDGNAELRDVCALSCEASFDFCMVVLGVSTSRLILRKSRMRLNNCMPYLAAVPTSS